MRKIIVTVFLFLVFSAGLSSAEEQLVVTTYYPSPSGAYNELQANRLAVGDTDLSGSLDPGDLPNRDGDLRLTPHVGNPDLGGWPAGLTGQVAYSSTNHNLYHYDGTQWTASGSGGGCYVSFTGVCLAGFTNSGSLGQWGRCETDGNGNTNFFIPVNDAPTNSRCARIGYDFDFIGTSAVCCK